MTDWYGNTGPVQGRSLVTMYLLQFLAPQLSLAHLGVTLHLMINR